MSKWTEKIPVSEKLDEVIAESMEELKRERRRQRFRTFAGMAAGLLVCAGCLGLAADRLLPDGEPVGMTGQGTEGDASVDGVQTLLVKEEPAEENRTGRENCLYMQESEGVSVTAANVHHNGYTLYMTVTVRSEEPFPSELRADLSGGLCRIGIESEGTVELQDARVSGNALEAEPEYMDGSFLDDRTFLGTVRVPLGADGVIGDDFVYDWSICSFFAGEGEERAAFDGEWEFQITAPADTGHTEVQEINGTNPSGEGIGCVIKTADDIFAQILLPEGAAEDEYTAVMCDASGAPLNRTGAYCRTENRDISTVYIFLYRRAEYEAAAEDYLAEERRGNSAAEWMQSLKECALYSTEVHFDSEYLSVFQAAWGGRK